MSTRIEVRVPDLGSFKDVAVIELLVKVGDEVEVDTPLVTLETEKATMDVPSTAAGRVESIAIAKGGVVNAGDLVLVLAASAGAATPAAAIAPSPAVATPPAAPAAPAQATPEPEAAPDATVPVRVLRMPPPAAAQSPASIPGGRTDLAPIDEPGFSRAHASPSVRRFARELGVDLARVTGSGAKGRILHDDVKGWVKQALAGGAAGGPAAGLAAGAVGGGAALPRVPVVDFAAFGPIETRPLNRVQKISGPRLHAAWVNLPHVTQFDEADITDLEATRGTLKQRAQQEGIKLTPLAFIIRAVTLTLAQHPQFNASLDPAGQNLVLKKYCHVGFAADTPNGLLVPVIRDADRKDVYELARALADLSERARTGKLAGADMQGGCFTVSSLGGIGGTAFTPIINAPEVAILGVSRSAMKPLWRDGAFLPRLMLPLSLSYDHRVIDGAAAARFTTDLAARLADVRGLLEAVP
jgi:pyruvate dehydrogenase E2 component (dihydrolipoamide acetyltransferase)